MVFSNIQAYLDPSNWQQQLNHQIGIGGTTSGNPQLSAPSQPQAPPPPHHGMGGLGSPGSIRPNSMSDRARMANIPMPEVALKCPRCESTNTKFCYFNNYSLSQPRHFCKTCRRYWTRGGALRSVPVGGGCRRNKRSKAGGSSSKSPVSGGGGDRQNSSSSTSSVSLTSTSAHPGGSILGMTPQMHLPPLRFMSPLSQLTQFSHGEIGLNYGGMSAPSAVTSDQMNFQTMNSQLGGGYMAEQWRMQAAQISSLAGLDLASNLYPFQGINLEATNYVNEGGLIRQKNMISSGLSTQMASVKMEDNNNNNNNNNNNQEMTLPRQFLGMQGNDHHQYWGANTSTANWTDLSGFSSSSTTNPL